MFARFCAFGVKFIFTCTYGSYDLVWIIVVEKGIMVRLVVFLGEVLTISGLYAWRC